ncbi:ArnT family glycosyltransferase [Marinicella rhabdoformis]|uniref:ArnT family glycosyltransferase n=1 Tax=Marinicella rhabdoformis TaxID=2580566 RepID=UPI0012AEDC68|nr:phospholipid carrier-dependent glycosyltransferase [Marinicella rhabdoformis]
MKQKHDNMVFYLVFALLACCQLFVMSQFELFGDEAFYWLEGQHLAWSYAELPGLTAWVMAFAEWLFPHHPFFLRLIPWLAAACLPFLVLAVNKLIHPQSASHHPAHLFWSLPLVGLVSVLSLPDIWLLFFTVLCVFLFLQASKKHHTFWFILLGLALALGINVHLRFWLVAAIIGTVTLITYWHHKTTLFKLITISLPLALIGLIPILYFNLQHDFPLLAFQLKDRHPWEFQLDHLYFIPVQILVTTPFVMLLFLKLIPKSKSYWSKLKADQKLLISTALAHWMLYFLLGFFSDNLRLNLHWPLLSYVLLFCAFSYNKPSTLVKWAIGSGTIAHFSLLITLAFWSQQTPLSQANQRITGHAQGWSELAETTQQLMQAHRKTDILADHFMTSAALAYQFDSIKNINTLPHPLSDKHGRSLQLQIMGFQSPSQHAENSLIVIEQTAIKLQDQVEYYQMLCQQLGGLQLLSQMNTKSGNKTYHFFEQHKGQCDMPALFYGSNKDSIYRGWVLTEKDQLASLAWAHTNQKRTVPFVQQGIEGHEMFSVLDPNDYVLNSFEASISDCSNCDYQLTATFKNHSQPKQTSQRFYP